MDAREITAKAPPSTDSEQRWFLKTRSVAPLELCHSGKEEEINPPEILFSGE